MSDSSKGTPLFDQNFAILYNDNVLIVLDTDLWADNEWNNADNSIFGINVSKWIAGSKSKPTIDAILTFFDQSVADGYPYRIWPWQLCQWQVKCPKKYA